MNAAAAAGVASRFLATARRLGGAPALAFKSRTVSFAELAGDVELLAAGFRRAGLEAGGRAALLARPSPDFFACAFALFRAGAVPVLVDPGIGFRNMGRCLAEAEPSAFVGAPLAHAARLAGRWAPASRLNVVAGGAIPGLRSVGDLRRAGAGGGLDVPSADADAAAAILFTSGGTGVPKGAVYTHGMFAAQIDLMRTMFEIREGEASVPTFPLFALFDVALGMTAAIPEMDFACPGSVDSAEIVRVLQSSRASQLFGSPALLDRVGRYGAEHGVALPDLRRVISAGAPVNARILKRFASLLAPGVQIFTPYGATEALPVAVIGSDEILGETAALAEQGRGVCVGRPVPGVEASVIAVSDEPIPAWSDSLLARPGDVGEIVVKGPVVSRGYFRRPEADALAKIQDGGSVRHRMGDLGYFDERGRLWFCGRKAHRVRTRDGELFTIQAEGVFNAHPDVKRTALVGAKGMAVLCVEKEPGSRKLEGDLTRELLMLGSKHRRTQGVTTILYHPSFPVDIRHNAKIFREKLAAWAERELA